MQIQQANPSRAFSAGAIVVHWLSFLLVTLTFALGWLHEFLEDFGWEDQALAVHRQTGLIVLLLLGVRLILRAHSRTSIESNSSADWLTLLSTASHWLLYLFLTTMPLLGWAMTNAQGHSVQLLGLIQLPEILRVDPDWADTLQEWHELCGQALLVLIGLHAAAALFHHYVLKDDVLIGMLPRRFRRDVSKSMD